MLKFNDAKTIAEKRGHELLKQKVFLNKYAFMAKEFVIYGNFNFPIALKKTLRH